MLGKIKNNLLYIGLVILALALLVERLFPIETDVSCFFRGLGFGVLIGGIVALFLKKKEKQSENQSTHQPIN